MEGVWRTNGRRELSKVTITPAKGVLVLCLIGLAFLSNASRAHHSQAVLELAIPPQVELNKSAIFEVRLKNTSDQLLWVNTRMALDIRGLPPGWSELWLEVEGPAGRVVYDCKGKRSPLGPQDYKVLTPSESVGGQINLECFDELAVGESYVARAHYHDRNPKPPPHRSAVHLSDEVVSASVRFRVMSK
jgi:hypothetical protein